MSRLRPLKILAFTLIGRPRCVLCGDHRALALRKVEKADLRICHRCARWIDAGFPREPLEATR